MSYYHCRNGERGSTGCGGCNGYVGPLDTYACLCRCHDGTAAPTGPDPRTDAAVGR